MFNHKLYNVNVVKRGYKKRNQVSDQTRTWFQTKSFVKQGGDNLKKRDWLINYRNKKGLSQMQVAKQIGVSQQMYNYIENNKRNPSTNLAKKIADVLNFSWTKFYED